MNRECWQHRSLYVRTFFFVSLLCHMSVYLIGIVTCLKLFVSILSNNKVASRFYLLVNIYICIHLYIVPVYYCPSHFILHCLIVCLSSLRRKNVYCMKTWRKKLFSRIMIASSEEVGFVIYMNIHCVSHISQCFCKYAFLCPMHCIYARLSNQ